MMQEIPLRVSPLKIRHLFLYIPVFSIIALIFAGLALRNDLLAGQLPTEVAMAPGLGAFVGFLFMVTVLFEEKNFCFDPVSQQLSVVYAFFPKKRKVLGRPLEVVVFEKRNSTDGGPEYFHFIKIIWAYKAKSHFKFQCDSAEDALTLAQKICELSGAKFVDLLKESRDT